VTGDFVFLLPFSAARFSPSATRAAPQRLQKRGEEGNCGSNRATEQRTFQVASHKVRTESLYDSALLRAAALLRYLLICIALIEVYYISRHFSASELKESFILERVSTG